MELAKEFLELEGQKVRKIVLNKITSDKSDSSRGKRVIEFSLFDIEIDYAAASVSIEEVSPPCRIEKVSLAAFVEVLLSQASSSARGGA